MQVARRAFLASVGLAAVLRPRQLWAFRQSGFWGIQQQLQDRVTPIILPPGMTLCPRPLVVPPEFVPTLDGQGTAMLVWADEGMDGIVASGPLHLFRTSLVTTATRGGDALRVTSPEISSGLTCRDVTIMGNGRGAWKRGIALSNCWNATLEEVSIAGYPEDCTPQRLANARMETAIDAGNAQELRIVRVEINNAKTGIWVVGPKQGDGEGVHLSGRFIINIETGIRLDGWETIPTGPGWIDQTHIFATLKAILAVNRDNLTLNGVDCCGSHFAGFTDEPPVGLHAVRCRNLRVTGGSSFRRTYTPEMVAAIAKDPKKRRGYGAVIDQSSNALITSSDFQQSLSIGMYFSGSTQYCRASGNINREPLHPVVNLGRDNRISD